MHEADHLVDRAVAEREARVAGGQHLGDRGVERIVDVDPDHCVARHHDRAQRPVGEADDAFEEVALRLVEDAGVGALGDHRLDLLLGHRRSAPRRGAARSPSTASVERRRNQTIGVPIGGEHGHRAGDEGGDALGVPERQPLRHQLADDQRDVGGGDHDDGEGQRAGDGGQCRYPAQHAGERLGQGGAGVGAGEDADQRDADLHRGEKSGRILAEPERPAGAAVAGPGHGLEPSPPGGDDGELGHGEEPVQNNEHQHDRDGDEHQAPRGQPFVHP